MLGGRYTGAFLFLLTQMCRTQSSTTYPVFSSYGSGEAIGWCWLTSVSEYSRSELL